MRFQVQMTPASLALTALIGKLFSALFSCGNAHVSAIVVDTPIATNAATKRAVPGLRENTWPFVRAQKTVKKSDTETFRYMAVITSP